MLSERRLPASITSTLTAGCTPVRLEVTMRPRLSLAGQFLALQLCIVVVVVGVVAAVSIPQAEARFRATETRRLLAVAEYVAADDTVRLLLNDERAREAQIGIMERSRALSEATFV